MILEVFSNINDSMIPWFYVLFLSSLSSSASFHIVPVNSIIPDPKESSPMNSTASFEGKTPGLAQFLASPLTTFLFHLPHAAQFWSDLVQVGSNHYNSSPSPGPPQSCLYSTLSTGASWVCMLPNYWRSGWTALRELLLTQTAYRPSA